MNSGGSDKNPQENVCAYVHNKWFKLHAQFEQHLATLPPTLH